MWLAVLLNVTPLFTAGCAADDHRRVLGVLLVGDDGGGAGWRSNATAPPPSRFGWWLAAGLALGLGFLCKYTNAMELGCIVWALAMVRRWRVEFRRPGVYAMALVAGVIGSPPVFWNASHAWITLSHLHDRGRLGTAFDRPFGEFFKFFTAHLGVYSPLVLIGLLVAVVWGWRRAELRFFFWNKPPGNVPRSPEPEAEKARFPPRLRPAAGRHVRAARLQDGRRTELDRPRFPEPEHPGRRALARTRPRQPPGGGVCRGGAGSWRSGPAWRCSTRTRPMRAAGHPVGIPPRSHRASARLARDRAGGRTNPRRRGTRTRRARLPHRQPLPARVRTQFLLQRKARRGHGSPDGVHARIPEHRDAVFLLAALRSGRGATTCRRRPAGAKGPRTAEEEFRGIEPSPFVGRSALYITDDERHHDVPGTVEDGFEQTALVAQYEIRRRGQPLRTLRVYACFNYKGLEL